MIALIIISLILSALVVSLISLAWVGTRWYAVRRDHQADADSMACVLYGRYLRDVEALTQAHLLQASSDEEWLAELKERVVATGKPQQLELTARWQSEEVPDRVGGRGSSERMAGKPAIAGAMAQVVPSQEVLSGDPQIISVSVVSEPAEIPKGMNILGLIAHVTESSEATANLERLIWSLTGLLVVTVGSISALVVFAAHYRLVGETGLASATIAGIMTMMAKIRLRRRHYSHSQGSSDSEGRRSPGTQG